MDKHNTHKVTQSVFLRIWKIRRSTNKKHTHCGLGRSWRPGGRKFSRRRRSCTAGTVALTSARCSLAEVDTTLLMQYRSQED